MKRYIIFLLLLSGLKGYSQPVYTKDSVVVGDRKFFEKECSKTPVSKYLEIKGVKVEYFKYCMCLYDNVIPNIYSSELNDAIENNTFLDLVISDKYVNYLYDCFDRNTVVSGEFEVSSILTTDKLKAFAVKKCIKEVEESQDTEDKLPAEVVQAICACTVEKISTSKFTNKDFENIDEDGVLYNEVITQCINEYIASITSDTLNKYNPEDVKGNMSLSKLPLIKSMDDAYKVKITIGGITKYFLFDTGATDLIINREFEMELILNGTLTSDNYLGKTNYKLANNEIVEADIIILNNLKFGDYFIDNVTIGVLENGSLLCGMGFLNKFKSWKIDKKNNLLIIRK